MRGARSVAALPDNWGSVNSAAADFPSVTEIPLPGAAAQPALCPVGGAFSSPDELFGGAFSRTRKRSHPPALRERRSASSVQRSQHGWRAGPAPPGTSSKIRINYGRNDLTVVAFMGPPFGRAVRF